MKDKNQTESWNYCNAIRNNVKRRYAQQFRLFLIGILVKQPERPKNLSRLGAQAVEIALRELLANSTTTH